MSARSARQATTGLPLPTEVDRLVRVPFDFEDYLALPEWHRAEYVDGMAIVSPSPVAAHQRISHRVVDVIQAGCPGLFVLAAVGVWTGERRSRIPDAYATERSFEGSWSDQTPVLVVEILSPSTRREDTLRKSTEYADAGIGQYWIVDRDHRTLTVLGNTGHGWDTLLDLDDSTPRGSVAVGDHGVVAIDLATLLAT
ncbi:Uma2 family endonuclease [Nocardioides plantarum]|uniref:Uma2 family endonuclease n=1 Tax=Nocardioides plantarum TaxID=29299 RepID=A0ABV5KGB2_9ACTN|nr:Uma2 family endonuclease [Nocardioides plantarum]